MVWAVTCLRHPQVSGLQGTAYGEVGEEVTEEEKDLLLSVNGDENERIE